MLSADRRKGIGAALGTFACQYLLDHVYVRLRDGAPAAESTSQGTSQGQGQPEFRLPLAILGGFLVPIAVAFYGWCAQLRLPLPVLLLSVVAIGFVVIIAVLPVLSYVVDAFGLYSASAMTAVIVTRCLVSSFLPIFTGYLTDELGYGWGFTVLMGISLLFSPVPVLVYRYGHKWRQRSVYTRGEMQ
jgi:hypothetical protein